MTETILAVTGTAFLILLAVAAGFAAGRSTSRAATASAREQAAARVAVLQGELAAVTRSRDDAHRELADARRQNLELERTIAPVRSALSLLTERVAESERARVRADSELRERVSTMSEQFGQAASDVRIEARRLSTVLSRAERRGAWGEMQLRTLVESSGMVNHIHFVEQDHTNSDDRVLRPDLVIDLAGGRRAVVDSKVPLDAFLRMDGDEPDPAALADHAQAVAQHIGRLAEKEYWRRYDSPEFVIMFLPAEGLLSAALESRPELLQTALDKRVVLATPTTLIAILHAVTHAWRQAEAAEQAKEIQELGTEFYRRLVRMARAVTTVGDSISRSAKAYDALVSTLEARVIPAGKRMESLSIADEEFPVPQPLDLTARNLNPARWTAEGPDEPPGEADCVDPQTGAPGPVERRSA